MFFYDLRNVIYFYNCIVRSNRVTGRSDNYYREIKKAKIDAKHSSEYFDSGFSKIFPYLYKVEVVRHVIKTIDIFIKRIFNPVMARFIFYFNK